jgi:hypothetical protein
MIEICHAQVGQPVYHVKEPDAPEDRLIPSGM